MVITKGYAHGTLPFQSSAEIARVLDKVRSQCGPAGYIRTPLHWNTGDTEPQWAKYDAFQAACSQRGIRWLMQVNTTVSGGGAYKIPTTQQWAPVLRKVVQRYWNKGVKAYEIWSEWNTVTGNANGTMTAAIMNRLLIEARVAIREEVAKFPDASKLNLAAMGIGTLSLAALDAMFTVNPSFLAGYNVLTHHLYMNDDPWLPAYRNGIYMPRRAMSLFEVRKWLIDHDFSDVDLGLTEGGYSGSPDPVRPPNVKTLQEQADLTNKFLQLIHDHNDELRIRFFCPFHPLAKGGTTYTGSGKEYDYDYWLDHLAHFNPDGSPKPVAPVFAAFAG